MTMHRRFRLAVVGFVVALCAAIVAASLLPGASRRATAAVLPPRPIDVRPSENACGSGPAGIQVTSITDAGTPYDRYKDANGWYDVLGNEGTQGTTFTKGTGGDFQYGGLLVNADGQRDGAPPAEAWVIVTKPGDGGDLYHYVDPKPGDVLDSVGNNITQILACVPDQKIKVVKLWDPAEPTVSMTVSVSLTCTKTLGTTLVTHTESLVLSAPTWAKTVGGITGWRCVAQETVPAGYTVTSANPTAAVDLGTSPTTFSFTNKLIPPPRVVSVTKSLATTQPRLTTDPLTFTYALDCGTGVTPVAGTDTGGGDSDGELAPGSTETWTVPATAVCDVNENEPSYSYSVNPPTPSPATTAYTITNTRRVGTLVVKKDASGFAPDTPFEFTVSCVGFTLAPGDASFTLLAPSGTKTITDIPTEASCEVTEATGNNFATTVSESPGTGTLTDGVVTIGANQQTVTFTNTKKATVMVTKEVTDTFGLGGATSFTYSLDCGSVTPEKKLATNDNKLFNNETEEWLVSTPATCAVTETGAAAANGSSVDLSLYTVSYAPDAAPTVAGTTFPVTAGSVSDIRILNTRKTKEVKVKKEVVGPTLDSDTKVFDYRLSCAPKAAAASNSILTPNGSLSHGEVESWIVGAEVTCGLDQLSETKPENFPFKDTYAVVEGTLVITNTRALGTVEVTKKSDAVGTFGFSVSCNGPNGQSTSGSVTVAPNQLNTTQTVPLLAWTPSQPPTGSSCVVTETANDLFTTTANNVSSLSVTVETGGTAAFVNTRKTEQLNISKTANAPGTFTFSIACGNPLVIVGSAKVTITDPSGDTATATTTPAGTTTPAAIDIPTGTSCTVTETGADPALSNWIASDPVTLIADKVPGYTFNFTNTRLSTLLVQKQTIGGIGGPFAITVNCRDSSGGTLDGFPKRVNLQTTDASAVSAPVFSGIPIGSKCTATEDLTEEQALRWTTKTEPLEVEMTTRGASLLVKNERRTGSLVISKTVDIPTSITGTNTASLANQDFTFTTVCDGVDDPFVRVVRGANSATINGIPTEVSCSVTESSESLAGWTVAPVGGVVTIKAIKPGTNTASFTNTLQTISITPRKVVLGQPERLAAGPFSFTLTCTRGAWTMAPQQFDITVPAGATSAPGTAIAVPDGANCTLREAANVRYLGGAPAAVVNATANTTLTVENTAKDMKIDLQKFASATIVRPGTEVTYTVTITNKGNFETTAFEVLDPSCEPLTKTDESNTPHDNVLQIGEVWTYSCKQVLNADTNNTATVTWKDPVTDEPKSDADSKFVDVIRPGIQIAKSADKSIVRPGTSVTYRYDVTNSGDDPIGSVSVTDDLCGSASYASGDADSDNLLDKGETWVFRCTQTLTDEMINLAPNVVENVATASGKDRLQGTVTSDQATARVTLIHPSLTVDKTTTAPIVRAGTPVTYSYRVVNSGDIELSGITVKDDKCPGVTGPTGDSDGDGKLDPLPEVWVYTCTQPLSASTTNTVTVGGDDPNGTPVTPATDRETVNVITPGVSITKTPSALSITTGGSVTYTYVVSNTGTSPLSAVSVVDDKCSPLSAPTGDSNSNALLDLSETWTYTCSQTLTVDTTNTATVTGTDATGATVRATAQATVAVTTTTTTTTTTTSTTTTTAPPAPPVAAALIVVVPPIPSPTPPPPPAPAPAQAPPATPAPTVAAIEVLAASLPTAPPAAQILGNEVVAQEPAFTGSRNSSVTTALLGLLALVLGLLVITIQRMARQRAALTNPLRHRKSTRR